LLKSNFINIKESDNNRLKMIREDNKNMKKIKDFFINNN